MVKVLAKHCQLTHWCTSQHVIFVLS